MHIHQDIKSLDGLPFLDQDGNFFLSVDNFVEFLKQRHFAGDKIKVRKDNIQSVFEKQSAVLHIDGVKYISFETLLKYAFAHSRDFAVCSEIAREVTNLCLSKESNESVDTRTILELYQTVAKSNLFLKDVEEYMLKHQNIFPFLTPSTLYKDITSCDVTQEWFTSVPIQLQCLLQALFVNKDSLRNTDNLHSFLQSKLVRLFTLFEIGLNTLNKNYIGIIQELNTQEMIVNYHNASSVFGITSLSAITASLSTAERWLQKEADPELCYYNSYIRRYPVICQKKGDDCTSVVRVSMQDCLNIFALDNLVRLTVHDDPCPGQTRTSQLCTLPVTVKGLPLPSSLLDSWHKVDCTRDDSCTCCDSKQLTKEDLALLQLTEAEREMQVTFNEHAVWGIAAMWNEIEESCPEATSRDDETVLYYHSDLIDDLNDTFESLKVTADFACISASENGDDTDMDMDDLLQSTRIVEIDPEEEFLQDIQDISMISGGCEFQASEYSSSESDVQYEDEIEDRASTGDLTPARRRTRSLQDPGVNRNQQHVILRKEPQDVSEATSINGSELNRHPDGDHDNILSAGSVSGEREQGNYNQSSSKTKFNTFIFPQLLCRHPTPYTGRDDDIGKLKEILLDQVTKLGRLHDTERKDRILLAPDHKISKNLLILMKENPIISLYLPEFPVLHLKKSKITNLFSGYKEAGLHNLLAFMKDEKQEKDWMTLVTLQHIETASRNIFRLSVALHIAIVILFKKSLSTVEAKEFLDDMKANDQSAIDVKWARRYQQFVRQAGKTSTTFQLHVEMMNHCDEIVQLSVAERLGGPDGYNLLLSSVKSSLSFSFLNGASAYAAFCVDLLHHHYACGHFHQNMKQCLFSTPHKNTAVNHALDTQREMDHRDVLKGFRPRSTINSALPRMAIIDRFTKVQDARSAVYQPRGDMNTSSASSSSRFIHENTSCVASNSSTSTNKTLDTTESARKKASSVRIAVTHLCSDISHTDMKHSANRERDTANGHHQR